MGLQYDASSIWGTIAAMATQLDHVMSLTKKEKLEQTTQAALISAEVDNVKAAQMTQAALVSSEVDYVKAALGTLVREFHISTAAEATRIDELRSRNVAEATDQAAETNPAQGLLEGICEGMGHLESKVQKVMASNDATAIQFSSLGFRTAVESNAYLAQECPGHSFGLLVDPHAVMEHLWTMINGIDILKQMEKLTKIKLETISEGIAISSFEATIPKFFTASGHRVVKMNELYWSRVTTWAEWEEPNTGCKVTLTDHLNAFQESHKEAIDIYLDPGSKFHSLCILALTDSCSFVESFLTHFENWQRELMLSKFGQAKALHVNTRVGSRFWELLAQPRAGVSRMLKTGNPQQIAQVTFWSTLKSLDIMGRIRKHNFKDDPVVSSELVKFLTVNTGFEVVEQMVVKIKSLEEANKDLTAKVSSNLKTSTNAAAKVADLLIKFTALEKRVKVLEK